MRALSPFGIIGLVALSITPHLHAQRAPAIPGVTGTMVTKETIKDEGKVANKAAVAVKDAVTRNPQKGPLADLNVGAPVVIHYNVDKVTEGVVSKVDWDTNEITIRYASKKTETLLLADKVPIDPGRALKAAPDGSTKIVEYSTSAGKKVARYFKPKA
jgi:hypothetical protein